MTVADPVFAAFRTKPGHCFRFIHAGTGQWCPERVVATGTLTDGKAAWWTVDACPDHAGELTDIEERTT